MWTAINSFFNLLFDGLLWPVRWLPDTVQLSLLGLPAALLALVVFRYVSNQQAIEDAKDKVKAYLLELRLYKDDLLVTMRAQGQILRYNAHYLGHALLPMAVMVGPFVLMLVQIESRFAYRGLKTGESAVLTVEMRDGPAVSTIPATLVLPEALRQDTPPLRIDETGEIIWRIRARAPGEHRVRIRLGETEIEKRLVVGRGAQHITPAIVRASDLATLAHPGEAPLSPDGPVRAVRVTYPQDRSSFLGLSSASWIFFAASLVLGFALRGPLGVTF